ncbi:MAG TPA: GGDEF domain-containing protein [Gaiellaceae bacterium]|nr:GGDEF domain-containing protein [Gaiellaceae bacterium]
MGDLLVELPGALSVLGADLRANGWELALEAIEEGLGDEAIPSLTRLGRVAQLGDIPTFISELGREVERPMPERLRVGGPLAAIARDHARQREALGFAPREVVMEFLLLRRVLWRFVGERLTGLESGDVIEVERRINDTIDRLVVECVVAYFDRATAELSDQARRDPLTGLLNHQAFSDILALELERARRYDHGLTIVFFDLDRFKAINDTFGHMEGDRVLNRIGTLTSSMLRGSDVAGRMGGDEFAVLLLETDRHGGERFRRRLADGVADLIARQDLPQDFALSAGSAHFPTDAADRDALLRLADARQYDTKRTKRD